MALFLVEVLLSATAAANPADCRSNPYPARARDEYSRLQFDRADRTLQRAIEFSRSCREELMEIYRLRGFVDAVNGERERCQRAFEVLLALNPDHRLAGDIPPKIRSCFQSAYEVAPARRRLDVRHRPPESAKPKSPLAIDVGVADPLRLVDQVQVYFRRKGVEAYTMVGARAEDDVVVVVPALSLPAERESYVLEYFVRAVDRWEGVLREVGAPSAPLVVRVEAEDRGSPIYAKWWFWTTIGVLTAGGVATAVAIDQSQGDDVRLSIDTRIGSAP
ncbi:MAG: hypothetical protein HC923_05985 [Myxococcales bacterium]|nr:hypothetical protein [Myxococcales bacterium]